MARTPPTEVIRTLRNEVGFGCPVPGCGNPYLEWHHFDPPYAEEAHHRPEGMIALCVLHHARADAGAYTKAQLRAFKTNRVNADLVRGKFEWLRNNLLTVVGGNFYYETPKLLVIDGEEIVWFDRDADGYLLLNVKVPSLSPEPRALIENNIWKNVGDPVDLVSPPSGKSLEIRYATGDKLNVNFREIESPEAAYARYQSNILLGSGAITFPITAVEVNLSIGGTEIQLSPHGTTLPNGNQFIGNLASHARVGFNVRIGLPWRQNTLASDIPKFPRNALCPCKSGARYKLCHGWLR